jgi:hypothetical protein
VAELLHMLIGKAFLVQAWTCPEGFQEVETSRFEDNRHTKVVRCSALRIGRLYHPGNVSGTYLAATESNLVPQCGRKNYVKGIYR